MADWQNDKTIDLSKTSVAEVLQKTKKLVEEQLRVEQERLEELRARLAQLKRGS